MNTVELRCGVVCVLLLTSPVWVGLIVRSLFRRPNIRRMVKRSDVDNLIKALDYKKDYKLRIEAAQALADLDDSRAVAPLTRVLKTDVGARDAAAVALSRLSDARALDALIQALEQEDGRVAEAAADALGSARDARAVEALIKALPRSYKNSSAYLNEHFISSLGQIGDPRAIPTLAGWLSHVSYGESAASALGKIGNGAAVAPLTSAVRNPYLLFRTRGNAAEALGNLGDPSAIAALEDMIQGRWLDGDDEHRPGAVKKAHAALAKLRSK